jgi:hypothetical protein
MDQCSGLLIVLFVVVVPVVIIFRNKVAVVNILCKNVYDPLFGIDKRHFPQYH